jgi:hypothetical protein
MLKFALIAILCFLPWLCPAQSNFRAYSNSVEMVEGGIVATLEIFTGNEHITVRVPRGYTSSVDDEKHRVSFSDKAGAMNITLQVTTDSPGSLPPDDILRSRALASYDGAKFLQVGVAGVPGRAAKFVDTYRAVDEQLTLKRRHAFVSCPEGVVEFTFSANSRDFEQGRLAFGLMLSSFQLRAVTPPGAPSAP